MFKYVLSLTDTVVDNTERNSSSISLTKFYQMKWAFSKVNFKVSQLQTWQKAQAKYNTMFERKRGFSLVTPLNTVHTKQK